VSRHLVKHLVWLLFVSLLVGCGSPGAAPATKTTQPPSSEKQVLRLGSTPWVPFTGEEGQPRVASYLVERALERAGYQARTTIVPDGALTPALEEGRLDGSAALWRSEDREKYLLYSKAYLENRLLLVGRKGSNVSATSFAALQGKRIAIVEGYAYGPELESAKEPRFVRVKSSQENLRALFAGTVDYCLLDALLVEVLFEQRPQEASERLEIGKTPLITRTLHFAVQKSLPNAARIIDDFNRVVEEMVKDGTYHLALQVTWLNADVDGDGQTELVPQGSLVGAAPPKRSYTLFAVSPEVSTSSNPPSFVRVEEQTRYYVNGHAYGSWEEIPDSLKLQPGANQVGAGHPQVKLIEW